MTRPTPRPLLAALLALAAMAAAGRPTRADDGANRKVHFLLVADTTDKTIGPDTRADVDLLKTVHGAIPADRRGELTVVDGKRATAADVLAAVKGVPVEAGRDALVCYVSSHGAYDPDRAGGDVARGHFLALPGGSLMRAELWDALAARGARLTVLLSDACNAPAKAVPAPKATTESALDGPRWGALAALFVRPAGAVDVSGASRDELGWSGGPVPNGWFTYFAIDVARDSPFADPAAVTWDRYLAAVADRLSEFYRARRGAALADPQLGADTRAALEKQKDQRPEVFRLSLGGPPDLDGAFYLVNAHTGMRLDLAAIDGKPDGATVYGWSANGQTNQRWTFETVAPLRYRLRNVWDDGKVLDQAVFEGNPDGAKVHGWSVNGQENQVWCLERLGPDRYRLKNLYTGKYLASAVVAGNPDGAKVRGWRLTGRDNQVWKLEPVGK